MPAQFAPPLPDLPSYRIAVTGHRRNRLDDAAIAGVELQIAATLTALGPPRKGQHQLLSGMADGADLAAMRACPAGWRMQAHLAQPAPAWAAMLAGVSQTDAASFARLLPHADLHVQSGPQPDYIALGHTLIAACDGLIGVWNGQPGRPGGTADVVAMAQAAGKPVLIIPVPA